MGRGLELRPGAVKDARAESGLSLAQVAAGHVTRAAIHRIERGQIRPSRLTLELIAERTGKPMEYFLADPTDHIPGALGEREIRRLQVLVWSRDHAEAIELGGRLLAGVHDPSRRATVQLALGTALVKTGALDEAREHLETALKQFTLAGDSWSVVDAKEMLALATAQSHDPRALVMFKEVLEDCGRLDPPRPDLESRVHRHVAAYHVLTHEWKKAIEAYQRALEVAGSLRDLRAMAMMYNGLAAAYEQMGEFARAVSYSHRALAVHEMDRDQRSIARVENNLGLVLLRTGQVADAEAHLRRSLALSEEVGLESGRSHVLLSLAELELSRGDAAAAGDYARQALASADGLGERMSSASAHQILAQVSEGLGDIAAADAEWHRALETFGELGATKRLMECHTRYSQILEARGDATAALHHTRQALALADPTLPARPVTLEEALADAQAS